MMQHQRVHLVLNMTKRKGSSRFYELIEEITDLHDRKNSNYSRDDDPLSNFKEAQELGVEPWRGALIRMSDKWSRLKELSKGKPDEVGESMEDTLKDLAVYSLLTIVLYETRK